MTGDGVGWGGVVWRRVRDASADVGGRTARPTHLLVVVVLDHALLAVHVLEPLVRVDADEDGPDKGVDFVARVPHTQSVDQRHFGKLFELQNVLDTLAVLVADLGRARCELLVHVARGKTHRQQATIGILLDNRSRGVQVLAHPVVVRCLAQRLGALSRVEEHRDELLPSHNVHHEPPTLSTSPLVAALGRTSGGGGLVDHPAGPAEPVARPHVGQRKHILTHLSRSPLQETRLQLCSLQTDWISRDSALLLCDQQLLLGSRVRKEGERRQRKIRGTSSCDGVDRDSSSGSRGGGKVFRWWRAAHSRK